MRRHYIAAQFANCHRRTSRDPRASWCLCVILLHSMWSLIQSESWFSSCQSSLRFIKQEARLLPVLTPCLSSAVNGNRYPPASTILEKYKVGKVIGDGNFAVVKECVERWVKHTHSDWKCLKHSLQPSAVIAQHGVASCSLMRRASRAVTAPSGFYVLMTGIVETEISHGLNPAVNSLH